MSNLSKNVFVVNVDGNGFHINLHYYKEDFEVCLIKFENRAKMFYQQP